MDKKVFIAIGRVAVGVAMLAAATTAGAQQMYKWVDARGVTHYSDQPPPPSHQKKVQVKSFSGAGGSVDLPFDLAQAVRSAPVTVYTTTGCRGCDGARSQLVARGVPHTEKTVSSADDIEQLKQAGGSDQLPFILVGRTRLTGFDAEALAAALDAAAYPSKRSVPPGFKLGRVVAAAEPKPAPAVQPQAAAAPQAPAMRTAPPPAATGFRF